MLWYSHTVESAALYYIAKGVTNSIQSLMRLVWRTEANQAIQNLYSNETLCHVNHWVSQGTAERARESQGEPLRKLGSHSEWGNQWESHCGSQRTTDGAVDGNHYYIEDILTGCLRKRSYGKLQNHLSDASFSVHWYRNLDRRKDCC